VNSGFYGLSGFVGAGLMFAGITDTCMMGMLNIPEDTLVYLAHNYNGRTVSTIG
jgi:hypothetical protein